MENLTLGRGKIYWGQYDDSGNPLGEEYIGATTEFPIEVSQDTLEFPGLEDANATVLTSAVLSTNRTGQFTTSDMSLSTIAKFLGVEFSTHTTTAETVVELNMDLTSFRRDVWYQIPDINGHPTGARNTTNVSLKYGTAGFTIPANGFTVDEKSGRVKISDPGVPATNPQLRVTYTVAAQERDFGQSVSKVELEGYMRFISDNAKGENRDYYFPKVTLSSNGAIDLKGNDWQKATFSLKILKKDEQTAAIYIDGTPT